MTRYAPLLAGVVAVAAVWELLGRLHVFGTMWPPLSAVLAYVVAPDHHSLLAAAVLRTGGEALAGLAIGSSAAILLASLSVLVPPAATGLGAFASIVNGVPVIAVAGICALTIPRDATPVVVAALAVAFIVFVAATANEPDLAVPPGKALGILAAATIACLVPFINKAFCVDDPLFLWAAAQIQAHPLDFYGCEVNWYGTVQPLYDVMKNPPLACYYLSAAAALVGTSEPALHAAFLLPAIGAVWGTWFLARSFCRQPVSAALVALVTPALLVSSTNVMCDTLLVCLWTWRLPCGSEGSTWRTADGSPRPHC